MLRVNDGNTTQRGPTLLCSGKWPNMVIDQTASSEESIPFGDVDYKRQLSILCCRALAKDHSCGLRQLRNMMAGCAQLPRKEMAKQPRPAPVAQGIEHGFPKAGVAGSIPAGGIGLFLYLGLSCSHHFPGNVSTNSIARPIHFFKSSSSSTPSGSTITQPFIDRPVMSNSTTDGSANVAS